jgi:hypothetical protein
MNRRIRPLGLALAGSLLLHAILFGGLKWTLPQWNDATEAPPIEVQLVAAPKPVVPPPVAAPAPPPKRVAQPKPRPPAASVIAPEPVAVVEPAIAPDIESPHPEASVDTGLPDGSESVQETAAPVEPAPPPLNPLPPRLDLRFRLSYGIASGEQTLVWVNEGERYTLTSVASATGLAGIFYRGHFVQTSRGRITPRGLQPEEFWDQRGSKHSRATFDAEQGMILLIPDKGGPRHFTYLGEVQDALSLFFQLALTAPPSGKLLTYSVFNGKKLRDYQYEVQGEELLDTRLGALRTLHLVRAADGDGHFEIWLALDRYYLPVRVRRSDEAGSEMELTILSITP